MVEAGAGSVPASAVPPDTSELWLIRHGETEWSRSGQHTGRSDIPLLPEGEAQAAALAEMLADVKPSFVLCSPLQRARHTAELAGLQVDDFDDDLLEWDYGDYEGLTSSEIQRKIPGWTLWKDGVPNGETAEQVGARADRVIARVIPELSRGPVVLIAHGHISRVLAARWIGLAPTAGGNLLLGTASPSVLGSNYGLRALVRWNMINPLLAKPR